ncbi:hypothetical protein EC991_002569 [Linnemannia zychae]|nr:hypothetical protein EC991_002569 [Linnemannia zychae]
MTAPAPTEIKIKNPYRVQVLVDFPDPTVTVAPVEPIAIPGRQRKFVAVADGDKSFVELKKAITSEFHRLYAEEAPYGLCELKNWNHCRIPERYLIRDVLGKECDIHVTRELLSPKKTGKSSKRKVEDVASSSSSSSASAASVLSVGSSVTAVPSTPAPKAKKSKKEAASAPTAAAAVEVKPKSKAAVKKESVAALAATPKDAVKDNAALHTLDGLSETQIMMRVSAAAKDTKETSSETTPEAASSSSSAPAVTAAPATPAAAKKKKVKKADTIETQATAPTITKTIPKVAAETKADKKTTLEDTKEKSEDDIMKEVSAKFQAQKIKEGVAENVHRPEDIKATSKVSDKDVPAAEAKKEQAGAKKEKAKKAKASTKEADITAETKVADPKAIGKHAAASAKESPEPAKPSSTKAKKVSKKGAESDASSESTPVAKKTDVRRPRIVEDTERMQWLTTQDPTTLTPEERHELRLFIKRAKARELTAKMHQAHIDAQSSDPEVAAAAKQFLMPRPRGRPPRTGAKPQKEISKFIQEKEGLGDDSADDESSTSSSSASSSAEAEAHVKAEQSVKTEAIRPTVRLALPPSFGTDSESDSDSD